MANLTGIFSGGFTPPTEKRIDPPDVQLKDAMLACGLEPPEYLAMDGNLHRFRSGTKGSSGKGGDKPGWYIIFGDGVPAGRFGCWRSGIEQTWVADTGRTLTPAEQMAHAMRLAEARAAREAELAKQHEVASDTVTIIWESAQPASPDHPYLARKGIQPHGARVTGDGRLVVPLYSDDGTLASLQYIAHDGGKLYHPGGQTGGKFWQVGVSDEPGPLFIAEGFATAASIHEASGRPCVVAYSASNLVPVTGALREKLGVSAELVVVADNDASGVGQKYAEQACAKYGARMVIPPEQGDANDWQAAGHDLSLLLSPPVSDWLIPADDFAAQPAPIEWLVKLWLQAEALIMVHGPSGGGKTFVVLDWCLRMAAGLPTWQGCKVRPASVVYLAGEGHHGLRGRIAAWKHHNSVSSLKMWLSRDGCDLNTPAGYLRVLEQVRSLPERPALIVVDTLHRFLLGDENSAQDAKTMLDACAALMSEFRCAVLLVHHTGVSDEAQHRARGSSAWRGALDIEISVVPGRDGAPIELVQRKSKDAEQAAPRYCHLESVAIPGWYDEDGEPVTSAVAVEAEPPEAKDEKKDSKIAGHKKMLSEGWFSGGAEERHGQPYVSRSALKAYMVSKLAMKESTADTYLRPGKDDHLIGALLLADVIAPHEHGWIVTSPEMASAMLLRKRE
jgi:putative DNA primase/helicase